jgi:hypothetical protein
LFESAPRARGCEHPAGCHTGDVPLFASATVGARHWVLIEHAGPWARTPAETALPESAAALVRRAEEYRAARFRGRPARRAEALPGAGRVRGGRGSVGRGGLVPRPYGS